MKLKYISWIPAVVLMCIIFTFSAKTAIESDEGSLQIANVIIGIYEKSSGNITDMSQKKELLLQVDHIVRKLSHGLEYGVLAIFVTFHLGICAMKRWKLFFTAILISGIYACTDEFHQLFVAGRSCQLTDVMIDTAGATIGATCFMILLIFQKRIRNKNTK